MRLKIEVDAFHEDDFGDVASEETFTFSKHANVLNNLDSVWVAVKS